jgi:hypothetical protein
MSGTSTDIDTWYQFYLQQVTAESYLESTDTRNRDFVVSALGFGNNRPEFATTPNPPGKSRLTLEQASEFWDSFQILHQWSDNPLRDGNLSPGEPGYLELNGSQLLANTGLSATLIQNRETGAYTLSIRSTEYVTPNIGGDKYRDLHGADLEGIAFDGLALAQIDALERYYEWLLKNVEGLSEGPLYVTGYSLGGHLATIFTEMHPEVVHTYIFNGAGRGPREPVRCPQPVSGGSGESGFLQSTGRGPRRTGDVAGGGGCRRTTAEPGEHLRRSEACLGSVLCQSALRCVVADGDDACRLPDHRP